jgi:hypothetical protein
MTRGVPEVAVAVQVAVELLQQQVPQALLTKVIKAVIIQMVSTLEVPSAVAAPALREQIIREEL